MSQETRIVFMVSTQLKTTQQSSHNINVNTHNSTPREPNPHPQMTSMFLVTAIPRSLQLEPSSLGPDHLPQRVAKVVFDLSPIYPHPSQKRLHKEDPFSDSNQPRLGSCYWNILAHELITLVASPVALVATGFPQWLGVMAVMLLL